MDGGIGIDLSGLTRSASGRTVGAALTDSLAVMEMRTIPYGPKGDRELVDWIDHLHPKTVAIDAPLSLPHGVGCDDPECERCSPGLRGYLSRDVDRIVGGMSTVMLAAIAFRGIFLRRHMERRGHRVIETYPRKAYAALGLRGGPWETLAVQAHTLGQRVADVEVTTQDELDAIVAGVVAVDHGLGRARVVRGIDGEIWLPSGAHLATSGDPDPTLS